MRLILQRLALILDKKKNSMYMKQKWIMLGIVMTMMAGSVQGQGFLKKLGNAVDKAAQKVDQATKKVDDVLSTVKEPNSTNSQRSKGNSIGVAGDNSFGDDGYLKYPNITRSKLFAITQSTLEERQAKAAQFSQFKKTANTKVIKVEKLGGYMRLGFLSDDRVFAVFGKEAYCLDGQGNVIKRWAGNLNNYFEYSKLFPRFDSGHILLGERASSADYQRKGVVYDKNFKVVKVIPNVKEYTYFQDGVAFVHYTERKTQGRLVMADEREKFAYYDVNGNQVLKNLAAPLETSMGNRYFTEETSFMRSVSEGLVAYFASAKAGGSQLLWGFRDITGKVVVPAKYDAVQDFSYGLAAVATRESGTLKWGFIDKTGRMVIAPIYTIMPSKFDKCGKALVIDKERNRMFINTKGEIVSKKYTSVTPFYNGKAFCYVEGSHDGNTYNGSYTALIDENFNEITLLTACSLDINYGRETIGYGNCYFNSNMATGGSSNTNAIYGGVGNFADNRMYLFVPDCGLCLLSDKGELLMTGLAGPFVNGLAPVEQSKNIDKYTGVGYVNIQGEWVIKFEENEF